MNDAANIDDAVKNKINKNKATTSRSFEYKTKLIGSTSADNNKLDAEVVALLRYLSNFWRFLDLPLIQCEIEVDLKWSNNWVIFEISRTLEVGRDNSVDVTLTIGATLKINNAKLYVPVVNLPISNNIKFLENIKQGFKRTISSTNIDLK